MMRVRRRNIGEWRRIEAVIRWTGLSTSAFARRIGLLHAENLYQIKRGNNGISLNVATLICKEFPEVDKLWLLTGENDMLRPTSRCRDSEIGDFGLGNEGISAKKVCELCIVGRILSSVIETGEEDPVGVAFRYAEELIAGFQKTE